MAARNPEEIHQLMADALNRRDLDALISFYEPEATFIPEPGQVSTGIDAIRQAFSAFLAMEPTINFEGEKVIRSGDIALSYSKWVLTGTGPDGDSINLAGESTEVARRQSDGTWLYVIDNPFGNS